MAEDARAWFQTHEELGLAVVGGYLSPVTDAYKKKARVQLLGTSLARRWSLIITSGSGTCSRPGENVRVGCGKLRLAHDRQLGGFPE